MEDFDWSILIPKTRREWFKFIYTVILGAIFIYFMFNTSIAYREGWYDGYRAGVSSKFVNLTEVFSQIPLNPKCRCYCPVNSTLNSQLSYELFHFSQVFR